MKARFFLRAVLACLLLAEAAGRTININGTLLNLTDLSGSFPAGAGISVSFELDDSVPDSFSASTVVGEYDDCISTVTVSVPSTAFSISGTAAAGHTFTIDTLPALDEAAASVEFDLTVPGSSVPYFLELEWLPKPGMPPASDDLTLDLSTSSFRLISAKFGIRRTIQSASFDYDEILGFGWERAGGVSSGAGAPDPVRKGGYDHPVVFGDSLSEAGDQASNSRFFRGGNTNGPVWVEYLSWLLHMRYVDELNFSAFGEIVMPQPSVLAPYAFDRSLGVYWSQSSVYAAVIIVAFAGADEDFFTSLRVAGQEEIVRFAETAYTLGLRDYLMLNTADITFAPLVKQFIPDAQARAGLRQLVLDFAPDVESYRQNWFDGLFPGMRSTLVNPNTYLDELKASPASFGFTNLDEAHLDTGPTPYPDHFGNPGSTYFFWDGDAPGTKVHAHLAGRIFDDVFATGPPLPFRARMVGHTPGEVWLFAANPPGGVTIDLKESSDLDFTGPPLRSFTTTDPCLFLIEDRPADPRGLFRFETP